MVKTIALIYLIMNVAGFYLMKLDKEKAKRNQYRISEKKSLDHSHFERGCGNDSWNEGFQA
ncbi:hypothetical protein HMPREF1013_02531 [Bacillus sp. 2_A_57_CT2]|nr:hypothetical protein HMPREF1013_02531 [Bacillus sp. 2_A_57_CT2]